MYNGALPPRVGHLSSRASKERGPKSQSEAVDESAVLTNNYETTRKP